MLARQRKKQKRRHGMVSVEFALTAPILFLLIFGSIEFTRANMLMHTTSLAASEGARRAIVAGATSSDVEQTVRAELSSVGITHAAVIVDPSEITEDTEVVAVGVGVPVDSSNGYLTPRFFLGSRFVKVTSMTREAKPSDKDSAKAKAAESRAENNAKIASATTGA